MENARRGIKCKAVKLVVLCTHARAPSMSASRATAVPSSTNALGTTTAVPSSTNALGTTTAHTKSRRKDKSARKTVATVATTTFAMDAVRPLDQLIDLLAAEEAALTHALKQTDESLWTEVTRQQLATTARNAAQLVAARLASMTKTPYVTAMDTAMAHVQARARAHMHTHA
jgi:hypothetical protein